MSKRKVFLDCEYLNRGADHPVSLISIGMVDDDGDEFYGINVNAPLSAMWRNRFIHEHIWKTLPLEPTTDFMATLDWKHDHPDIANVYTPENLREHTYQFLVKDGEPEIWGSYSGFDYVLLSQMFGTFEDARPGIPMFIHDIQQLRDDYTPDRWDAVGAEILGLHKAVPHHALDDARAIKLKFQLLHSTDDEPTEASGYGPPATGYGISPDVPDLWKASQVRAWGA